MASVGVPREVKEGEHRVALTPAGVDVLRSAGHEVVVEHGAGAGCDVADAAFANAGARLADAQAAWECDLVVKVKEPQDAELARLRPGLLLFTYLHLAAAPEVAGALVRSGATGVAYETVQDRDGRLPLLAPMSEIAGRLATQAGAWLLERPMGGRGVLLGGVAGVAPGRVVILGGGTAGMNAAIVAAGMQAHVTVLDTSLERLRAIEATVGGRIELVYSTPMALAALLPTADLVIGAVLVPGARAPRLITRDMLGLMRRGTVLVDVAVDQGGCAETSRATTHADPVYEVDGVLHYCVANMPGAVPVTSTQALCNATLPYVAAIASHGLDGAITRHPELAPGVNVRDGAIVNAAVAAAL